MKNESVTKKIKDKLEKTSKITQLKNDTLQNHIT